MESVHLWSQMPRMQRQRLRTKMRITETTVRAPKANRCRSRMRALVLWNNSSAARTFRMLKTRHYRIKAMQSMKLMMLKFKIMVKIRTWLIWPISTIRMSTLTNINSKTKMSTPATKMTQVRAFWAKKWIKGICKTFRQEIRKISR